MYILQIINPFGEVFGLTNFNHVAIVAARLHFVNAFKEAHPTKPMKNRAVHQFTFNAERMIFDIFLEVKKLLHTFFEENNKNFQ